jgi:TrmH family RNA methyltransferase
LARSSPSVRRLRHLLTDRDDRDAQGVFVVEGARGVASALAADADVEAVHAAPAARDRHADVVDEAARRGVPVEWMTSREMETVADTVTPQPVLAVVRMPAHTFDAVDMSLVVVLADVREPGNAGTIVRSAEAAGASAVVFCRGSADAFGPKVVRASAGALFHVPVVRAGEAREVLEDLGRQGVRRLGTSATGGEPYDRTDWSPPVALVLGNEAWGLPDDLAPLLDGALTIPMKGRSESLNVAMAASILLFQAARA